jgi:cytochrome c5
VDKHDAHESFIKTPQQLIVVILAAFLVPIFGIILVVQLVLSRPGAEPQAMTPEAVAARLQPVGRVEIGTPGSSSAPAGGQQQAGAAQKSGPVSGKAVYDKVCVACHQVSVAGSPKIGDKAAWAPRIKTGTDALVQSVIKGKGAMPPKAGNPSLSDAEIRAAVEFMTSQSK